MTRIFYNFRLKVLSVFAAVVLWLFVVGAENTVYQFPQLLEIQPVSISPNLTVATELSKVKVYLKGAKEVFEHTTAEDFEVKINGENLSAGDHEVPVSIVSKQANLTIVKIEPSLIKMTLIPVSEKEISVEVIVKGEPKKGYKLEELKPETKKVKIKAAQNVLDKVTKVNAELVLSGNETKEVQQTIVLTVPGFTETTSQVLTITPDRIGVKAGIIPETKEKELKIIPQILNADPELINRIVLQPSTITVQGTDEVLKNLKEIRTVSMKSEEVLNMAGSLELKLIVPDKVLLANPEQKITLKLKDEVKEQKTVTAKVSLSSSSPDFTVTKIIPAEIEVTVTGIPSIIKKLKTEDITVKISIAGKKPDEPILVKSTDISTPSGLEVVHYSPAQIKLETEAVQ